MQSGSNSQPQRTTRPGSIAAPQLRRATGSQTIGKIIDWEGFHYGMLDHKFLNDANPAKAAHRMTIYELWVGELIEAVLTAEMPIYSKDGQIPARLKAIDPAAPRTAEMLIGTLFDSEILIQHMEAFFNKNKELH